MIGGNMVVDTDRDTPGFRGRGEEAPALIEREAMVREFASLPGNQILSRITEHPNPRHLVRELPCEDFFWLVKRIGDDDCLPLLELASAEQWHYVLDLEIWERDQMDVSHTLRWMTRLLQADPGRLVHWLFSEEGESLALLLLRRTVQIMMKTEDDEAQDIPDGFFSLEGDCYIRMMGSEHQETVENLLREMAAQDFTRYFSLMGEVDSVISAETEEELYRLRNVRLAEHGFLPFEEALSIYVPLSPDSIVEDTLPEPPAIVFEAETLALAPVTPVQLAPVAQNTLMEALAVIRDPLLMDRIRLEFAGLCNRLLSADGTAVREGEVLMKVFRKAGGYLNIAMEKLCGDDSASAITLMRRYPLQAFFRIGFGLALKLKWEAERWIKKSWFHDRGLTAGFWGDQWGEVLVGILKKRPLFYAGFQEGKEYRDFERLSEVEESHKGLQRIKAVDDLLGRLTRAFPLDERLLQASGLTFRPFLFTFWARRFLSLEPAFREITPEEAGTFLSRLRGRNPGPPFRMPGGKEAFVKDLFACAEIEPKEVPILEDTLSLVWQEFSEEYENVSPDDLDWRYSKFISLATSNE